MKQPRATFEYKNSWLLWGLLISTGVHVCLMLLNLLGNYLPTGTPLPEESANIEVTEIPPQVLDQLAAAQKQKKVPLKLNEQEIAESEKAPNNEIDPNAKFLSDKNQKVEKQTRAKKVDDFRKHEGSGPKGSAERKQDPTDGGDGNEGVPTNVEVTEVGVGGAGKNAGPKKDWRKLSLSDLGVGGDGGLSGASDDRLADVADGNRTILSTREYKYFSYYHRIKELLRQYWKPMVEQKLFMLFAKGKSMGEDEVTTRLMVLLTQQGTIAKISRMTSSGVTELDEAAMEAFHKAGPFPNPPSGIVDPDGFVRIRWDFILKTEASPRIQFSGAGGAGGVGGRRRDIP